MKNPFDKGLHQIYRGLVVSNKDPLKMARIKVRVPGVYGESTYGLADDEIPFAVPCTPFASYHSGQFLIPEVGSTVFILFENGDLHKPVYIGQMYSKGDENAEYLGYTDSKMFVGSDGKRLKRGYQDDMIENAYNEDGSINRHVLLKTPKGATIEVNENDEEELLAIHDRRGQAFVMSSPTSILDNAYNRSRRGLFSVLKETFNDLIFKQAIVLFKALSGSIVRMISHNGYSQTDVNCVYQDEKAGIQVNIGEDNRLLIYYKDSFLEMSENTLNCNVENIQFNAKNIVLNAEKINSTANIHVGEIKSKDIKPPNDNDIENTLNI